MGGGGHQGWFQQDGGILPFARERSEAARLDVDAAVSVGLVLVGGARLHLREALIGRDGVDLHPALPGLLLTAGRLGTRAEKRGENIKGRREKHWPLRGGVLIGVFDEPLEVGGVLLTAARPNEAFDNCFPWQAQQESG